MTKSIRFVLLLSACALALAFGGNALAAYNPSLLVAGTSHSTGSGGPVVIGVGQDQNDDATGVLNIYAPLGYGVTLTQAPGTRIGDLEAIVLVRALANARVPIQGTVTARDPGAYVNPQQFPCGGGVRHEAVWLIESTLAGNPLQIPIYVDRVTTGAEAQFASAKMRICLASPYVPPPQGAAAGASLIVAAFSVAGVFSNPNTRGTYPWNALFVPYQPGTATLNPANAAQSTSYTRLPVQLAVTAKKLKKKARSKRRFARVTACVSEAGQPVRGVRVNILAGRTARRTGRVAFGRTNSRGCLVRTIRLRYRTTFIRASTSVPERDVTSAPGCTPPLSAAPGQLPPARCTSATLAPALSLFSRNTARVRR
ncbi:MAG TPA: hypothetical protein VGW30_00835 [Gaiellaceae bacterium]|nr:hypothetical protein [Gaiellaceae bacterium]